MTVGPLGEADLARPLAARRGAPVPRPEAARLHRMSGGNPFFALELLGRDDGPGGACAGWSTDRLARSRTPRREAVELAAALSRPTPRWSTRGSRPVCSELDGERVRFAHPLLARAGVRAGRRQAGAARAGGGARRRARGAGAAPRAGGRRARRGRRRRARRRSAAGAGPRRAGRRRGAARAGAAAHAGPGVAARRRGRRAPSRGRRRRARADAARGGARRGPAGARPRVRAAPGSAGCARTATGSAPPPRSSARALAGARGRRRAADRDRAGPVVVHALGRRSSARRRSTRGTALALAEELGEPTLLARALSHVAFLDSLTRRRDGDGDDRARAGAAAEPGWTQILGRPDWIHALLLFWDGRLAEARDRLAALHAEALERGDEHSLPFVLFQLARVELLLGDWESAQPPRGRVRGDGRRRAARPASGRTRRRSSRSWRRTRGEDEARAQIARGLELAERLGVQPGRARAAGRARLPRALARRRAGRRDVRRAARAGRGERAARAGAVPLARRRDRGQGAAGRGATRSDRGSSTAPARGCERGRALRRSWSAHRASCRRRGRPALRARADAARARRPRAPRPPVARRARRARRGARDVRGARRPAVGGEGPGGARRVSAAVRPPTARSRRPSAASPS